MKNILNRPLFRSKEDVFMAVAIFILFSVALTDWVFSGWLVLAAAVLVLLGWCNRPVK